MTRPKSIAQFELLYLAAFVLGVISTIRVVSTVTLSRWSARAQLPLSRMIRFAIGG